MGKRRVLLLCVQSLLGESLENILSKVEDVELIGPWVLDAQTLARLSEGVPDIVLVAEEGGGHESAASLTAQILDHYPDIPVIRVGLAQDTVRLYTSQRLPPVEFTDAHSADLIEVIRSLPAGQSTDTTESPSIPT